MDMENLFRDRHQRRLVLKVIGAGALAHALPGCNLTDTPKRMSVIQPEDMNVIQFEETLAAERNKYYRYRQVDMIKTGFRPVGGNVADFAVAELNGQYHFFYIERRIQEGTPFYPGHEMYFGHASTEDWANWEVHDPVMLVRPDSWEEAHVWAPCIVPYGSGFIMAYTGVNRHLSQNLGLASSTDLFRWTRWDSNPLSPCRDRPWAFWRSDGIASCRDPNLCEHGGRYFLTYTANTREGASCIAMTSTTDFRDFKDHGPICIGPATGYVPRREGGHPQGSLESANLVPRAGRWFLTFKAKVRNSNNRSWIIAGNHNDRFDFSTRQPFWPGSLGVEVIKDKDQRSLVATFSEGHIRLGVADWSRDLPTARFMESEADLREWRL